MCNNNEEKEIISLKMGRHGRGFSEGKWKGVEMKGRGR